MLAMNLYEAKTRLSALVDQAAQGHEFIIAKNGRPMAKLVPFRVVARRKPGQSRGKITLSANFDAPLPKRILAAFLGGTLE
jgi:prevent-host-death family protein